MVFSMELLFSFLITVFVTLSYGYNLRYVMDKLDYLEAKFEMENKMRRSETQELFRLISELSASVQPSTSDRTMPRQNPISTTEITSRTTGRIKTGENKTDSNDYLHVDDLRHYLVKGAAAEKLESTNIRRELSGIRTQLQAQYAVFESHVVNQMQTFSEAVTDIQTKFSTHLKNLNKTVSSGYTLLDSKINAISSSVSDIRSDFRHSIDSLKLFTERSLEELQENLTFVNNFVSTTVAGLRETCKHSGKSGIYEIFPDNSPSGITVYCDQTTDGGGWIVFQRRQDGSVDFYRDWADYKVGFGNLSGEFWLGNDNLHFLTTAGFHELRIDMEDFEGNKRFARYSNFKIKAETEKYAIEVSGYSGNAGNSLEAHNRMNFSTKDKDNDNADGRSCSTLYLGGWWYNNCHRSNLNGYYYSGKSAPFSKGINWYDWRGYDYSLKYVEMKVK